MDQGIQSNDAYLMVGTVGLDIDDWQGGFYDEDLPADWRVASYSTLLRSVMLPAQEWKKAVEQNWADEVDDEFRFVLAAGPEDFDAIESLPQSLTDKVSGLVIQLDKPVADDALFSRLSDLAERYPACIDAGSTAISQEDIASLCDKLGAGQLWRPEQNDKPRSGGSLQVAILGDLDLPGQRAVISALEVQMNAGCLAGLFHATGSKAAERAQQTRMLAEMMGV